jgi:hypothetical protein
MVKQQGIDVYLAPYGKGYQRYPEHPAPVSSSSAVANSKDVYIEAVDGERFILVIDLMNDFDAKGSPMLRVDYGLDSSHELTGRWSLTGTYTYEKLREIVSGRSDLKGRETVASQWQKIGEQWFECGFVFSPLEIGIPKLLLLIGSVKTLTLADEDLDLDPCQVSKHVEGHGKIVVSISRGNSIAKAKGTRQPLSKFETVPDTVISSKAVVKDNHVSHAIK